MPKVELRETKRIAFLCPDCESHEHIISHLVSAIEKDKAAAPCSFGPWYCDECGFAITGTILEDLSVDVVPVDKERQQEMLLLLRLRDTQIYFVMKSIHLTNPKYYVEEHSCPSNFLRFPAIDLVNEDIDPHGLLEFIEQVPMPKNWTQHGLDDFAEYTELFSQLGPKIINAEASPVVLDGKLLTNQGGS